jgi:uncharacterized repeat protein (TIGR02543 family)
VGKILFYHIHYKLISLLLIVVINACSSESTDDVTITPPVIEKFTLIVNSSEGGSVNTVGGEYTKGSNVTITATPNQGYVFSGWSGNSNSTEPSITLVMEGNISITATFTQIINKYTLQVLSTEGGNVDIEEEEEEYEEGTTVEITASAEENYQFINWTDSEGNIIGEDLIISITIDNDIQIQANFALVPENIEFSNPEITSGILSGEFAIDYQVTGDFTGVISKGVTLNDSIYTDDISENKISLTIESLEYQEYQVKFFVETSSGQYFSDSFTLIPNVECASVELLDTNMNLEQEFCTYEQISNIKLAYSGTNILVEYDEDLIPSGINISDENGIVEISGTPFPMDSDTFTFDLKFLGLGDCEDITKTVTLNRSPNSPKINYISGSLNQTITAGGQIEPIEFQYAGSAQGFSFTDLPDGLSYSVNGTTYKIEGSLNTAGSYSSTITTINSPGCSELSESFSFEVNQPVSSGGGGSSEPNFSELQTSLDLLNVQITLLLVSLAETTCASYSSSSSTLQSTYQTNINEYNRLKNLVNNSTVLSNQQSASLLAEVAAIKADLDNAASSFATFPCPRTYIPDDNFEQVLIDNGFDDVLDDYVFTINISGISCFSSPEQRTIFHEKGITDMTGIQDFTSLKFLSLYGNPITSIDVSSLANLSYIDLGNTNISSVDLSNNSQLMNVYLYNNTNLTSVNVTGLSNLRVLNLSGSGSISSINVSSSDKLTSISGLNSISCITVSQSQLDNQVNGGVVPADYTTNSLGQRTYNYNDSCNLLNVPAIDWGNDTHKSKFKLSCN